MKKHTMSEKKYVKDRCVPSASIYPIRCPVCRSEDTEGKLMEIDADYAIREMYCHDCGSWWEDNYTLTGYSNLKPGKFLCHTHTTS